MAETSLSQAQIHEHGMAIFKTVLRADPDSIYAMIPALEDYVPNGTVGTIAQRREAVRLLLNFHWKQVRGHPYNGHDMKHHYQAPQDVPDLEEPAA